MTCVKPFFWSVIIFCRSADAQNLQLILMLSLSKYEEWLGPDLGSWAAAAACLASFLSLLKLASPKPKVELRRCSSCNFRSCSIPNLRKMTFPTDAASALIIIINAIFIWLEIFSSEKKSEPNLHASRPPISVFWSSSRILFWRFGNFFSQYPREVYLIELCEGEAEVSRFSVFFTHELGRRIAKLPTFQLNKSRHE